jgi:hypothetical protein
MSIAATIGGGEIPHDLIQEFVATCATVTIGVKGGELIRRQHFRYLALDENTVSVAVEPGKAGNHIGQVFLLTDAPVTIGVELVEMAFMHGWSLLCRTQNEAQKRADFTYGDKKVADI